MFDEMVSLLKQGKTVQPDLLRKRFDRALVKKLGVVKTPYPFWSSDKKINPSAKELRWAAVLLEDRENFILVEGIITTELNEKKRLQRSAKTPCLINRLQIRIYMSYSSWPHLYNSENLSNRKKETLCLK